MSRRRGPSRPPVASGVNRPVPLLTPDRRKTYQATETPGHYVSATCEDVGCGQLAHGFRATIDESTDLGMAQAYFIRYQSDRRYREDRDERGLTVFTFAAGQRCFTQHRRRLDRPPLYVVRGGDHRGNPRAERRVHDTVEHWAEDLHEHTDKLAQAAR